MESNIRALGLRSWGGGQGRARGRGGACSGVWAACVRSCRGKFPGPGHVRGHRAKELGCRNFTMSVLNIPSHKSRRKARGANESQKLPGKQGPASPRLRWTPGRGRAFLPLGPKCPPDARAGPCAPAGRAGKHPLPAAVCPRPLLYPRQLLARTCDFSSST